MNPETYSELVTSRNISVNEKRLWHFRWSWFAEKDEGDFTPQPVISDLLLSKHFSVPFWSQDCEFKYGNFCSIGGHVL